MIRFLKSVFKWPQRHSIYWALKDTRAVERVLRQPVAYCYMTRDINCIADNMARWALEAQATITFWDGQLPDYAPGNQLQDVYKQQSMKPWLDWASLPELFNWITNQPNPQPDITVATVFWQRHTIRVVQLYLWEAWCQAAAWLCKVANMDEGLPYPVD